MNQLGNAVGLDGVQNLLAGRDVVANELLIVITPDLGLQHDDGVRTLEVPRPVSGKGQVHLLDRDVRLDATQDVDIGGVLVQHDDVLVAPVLQPCNQVLSHQPGTAGQDDLLLCIHVVYRSRSVRRRAACRSPAARSIGVQISSLLKTNAGRFRITNMISAHLPGV